MNSRSEGPGTERGEGTSLLDLLALERIDRDLYRATTVFADPWPLYGGQVAAQALRAAGATVDAGRLPHSLHGYFLRPGDASQPTVLHVHRDRDGRSYSARRVVAVQDGDVIFSMAASFHRFEEGPDAQEVAMPDVAAPYECGQWEIPRLFSFEGRTPQQPYQDMRFPTRFWARCTVPLEDPLLQACALTYLSDIGSGLMAFETEQQRSLASLDHAVWFHRPVRADEWVLNEMVPHTVSAGRGWYTGSLFAADGTLVASLAQESLFRTRRGTG